MKRTTKSASGTSFHGHTITATRQEMIDALGEPDYTNGVEEKSQYEWHRETDNGDIFTIYDWKTHLAYDANVELDWHIGGHNWTATSDAKEEVKAAMACASEARAIGEDVYVDHDDDPETRHWKGYAAYLERNAYDDADANEL